MINFSALGERMVGRIKNLVAKMRLVRGKSSLDDIIRFTIHRCFSYCPFKNTTIHF